MFTRVDSISDLGMIEAFVKDDYFNCPFLYANLIKYGKNNEHTMVFAFHKDNSIVATAFMYYECLHVYFRDTFADFYEVEALVNELNPRTMFFPSYANKRIPSFNKYNNKEVLVMAPKCFQDIDITMVKNAEMSDIPRIAEFMCTEWADRYESPNALCEQIQERMKDNYGRTKYIEDNGKIVACVSSYAELNDFAICGGLLVSDSQRGKKLGSVMLKSIYQELENEGKQTCGIIVEDYSRVFHEKNGFAIVGKILQYNREVLI
ncbi:GNAT family N-acetyltransferase [Butyrivibrio sp. VCD2006]|uniref:GNAT family N-acetyltransferase n=1 Tax=Butyrivibrio sp. VCD2006 TaxID=1280664 RepID=UPI0003F790FA|nr:GNAT family N-acetyltransferase [Butyrivibrio sp. VCD2006]